MTKRKRYYATQDRNGTEDEITIYSPQGKSMAFIWFWNAEEGDVGHSDAIHAKASATLIVEALNAYDPTGEKSRNCHATMPGMIVVK